MAGRFHTQGAYRSGSEIKIKDELAKKGVGFKYEEYHINYVIPQSDHKYTPDFVLPNGVIVECKGQFVSDDRKKHELLIEQYPDLDIRFVFDNPNSKLYKGSPTTYAIWCDKRGIKYAKKSIPLEWIKEAYRPLHPALVVKKKGSKKK